jgi:DNA topoisomerase-3
MTVCIAEKPSVAGDIAKVLGANSRKDGYYEGNGYQVTWTFGHLCCLKNPEEYNGDWKKWSLTSLPMIPERFGINLIPESGIKKQFGVIKKIFAKADTIVNCGDAGQEGELIQRWVMQLAEVRCPVKRLWISSLTEESIRDGFRHLKDQRQYDNLYYAGLARATGDWLLGLNLTRLYSLLYGNDKVLSIGRVQTPTLAMLVNRKKEIDHFKPEPYWQLTTIYKGITFLSEEGNYTDIAKAELALQDILGKEFCIDSTETKAGKESIPQQYDLTSLQVECNRRFGYSAETTLDTVQSLYEKKVTTYPRVDTRYLSDDIYPKCPDILKGISGTYGELTSMISRPIRKSKKVFDSTKVTDHHAIIPTGKEPHGLTEKEGRVFDLIAKRFISAFCEDCAFLSTVISAHSGSVKFKITGKEITDAGWRVVYRGMAADEEEKDEKDNVLPHFTRGERGEHHPSLQEKWTMPPVPYTEATLLRAMETAGKFVVDEELRAALKQNGIGRPSSRAGIIETIIKRGYVRRQQKQLLPTDMGMSLIDIIKTDLLKSPELTGIWEKKLREIEDGHYDPALFMEELKHQLRDITDNVRDNFIPSITVTVTGSYPKPKARYGTRTSGNGRYRKKR